MLWPKTHPLLRFLEIKCFQGNLLRKECLLRYRDCLLELFLKSRFALKTFKKISGKYLCWNFFFNETAVCRLAILLKGDFSTRCLPMNFAKILKTPIIAEHLWTIDSCYMSLVLSKYDLACFADCQRRIQKPVKHSKPVKAFWENSYFCKSSTLRVWLSSESSVELV